MDISAEPDDEDCPLLVVVVVVVVVVVPGVGNRINTCRGMSLPCTAGRGWMSPPVNLVMYSGCCSWR